MRHRTSWANRLKWGVVVAAATVAGLGGTPAAGGAVERASAPPQANPNDTSNAPNARFDGYVGYLGAAGAGAAAAPVEPDDPASKPDDPTLGDPADASGQDVAGATESAQSDLAVSGLLAPSTLDSDSPADLAAALDAESGTVRVNVYMNQAVKLEAGLNAAGVDAQRASVADSLDGLDALLAGTGSAVVSRLESVPAATVEADQAGLDALLADASVASVTIDRQGQSTLASSTGVIDSDLLNAAGVLGNNFEGSAGFYEVAILDSGVDFAHNAFAGRISDSACFSAGSDCPNGLTIQIGGNAGDDCTHSTDCDHGTHVGGIAAGAAVGVGREGVARGARIMAMNVASDSAASTRWTAFFSDIDLALQRVLNLRNAGRRVVSVNLSIGGGLSSVACDTSLPATAALVNNLAAAGVSTVIAAGNDGSNTQVSFPGCLTNAETISASDDADVPAGFTNSNAVTDYWAPGVNILAPVPTGNNQGSKNGTSMSTPHVVGALALLRECVDGNGVPITRANAIGDLDATGVNITRNGVTRKRINILDAATSNVNNNDFASPEVFAGNGPFNDFDFNVCADSEAGEPGPFSIDNSIWWRWTPATTGTATISTEDSGTFLTTFDTTLVVYTGNTLGTLVPIASDDDSGTGLRSLVTFPVNGGTTYRIKVDGFAAQNGLMNLHIQNGAPPACFGVLATIVGTNGNDVINGTAGNDVIVAGAGNDTVNGLAGNDRVCGGLGDDTIFGGTGNDFVLGDQGSDTIFGESGNDTLVGNPGGGSNDDAGDVINGGSGNDFVDGWFGNDVLQGGPDDDTIQGAAGNDTGSYSGSPVGISASLTTNTATGLGNDTFTELLVEGGLENLRGSPFNDRLTGDAGPNLLSGGVGDDRLDGMDGDDSLLGGTGDDLLIGRLGNDAYNGEGDIDTAYFGFSPAPVVVNLTLGTATGEGNDTIVNTENVIGSSFADNISGDALPNRLDGRNANDTIRGVSGADSLLGGVGNDSMSGGLGNDSISGQDGNDTMLGDAGADRMSGDAGADSMRGGDDNDVMAGGDGADNLRGENGNDNLTGNAGFDTCSGGPGFDAGVCEVEVGIP